MRQLFLLLALLVGVSFPAFAEDYWWSANGGGTKWPSPQAGCDAAFVEFKANTPKGEFNRLTKDSETQWSCVFWNSASHINITSYIFKRGGYGCSAQNSKYNPDNGMCEVVKPSDGECLARDPFTKKMQFSFSDGSAVLGLDPEIKDGCIYEPGEPKNCTDTSCDVEMKPVGNDDMSDNSQNPEQDLQDYLDELAKQFKCEHVANGTVGCSAAETTPPDIDPDDKCPDGYSWSGTACFPTNGGGNENPDNPTPGGDGGSSGGGSTGGSGGDGGSTGGDGSGDGSSGGGGGGNDGDDGDDKEPGVEGTACDKAFKCTGDAVNCAIAERQKNAYCENKELQDAQKGFDKIGEEIGQEKYTMLDGGDVDIGSLFGEGARFLPSACPAVSTTTLHVGPLQFNWQPVCQYAELVGKFLVAWASLFFATYVGRAFGGD